MELSFFKRNAGESGMDQLSLMCRDTEFPSNVVRYLCNSGRKNKSNGHKPSIYTWRVDSPVKEQQEHNRFIEDSRDLWDEFQRLAIKERSMRSASETERKALRTKSDSISSIINQRELKLMKELPISNVWMEKIAPFEYVIEVQSKVYQ